MTRLKDCLTESDPVDVEVDFGLVDVEEVGMSDWWLTESPANLPTSVGLKNGVGELSGSRFWYRLNGSG